MKLVFVIHSLQGGGAERVVSRLCHWLAAAHPSIDTHVVLFKPRVSYSLPPVTGVHVLGKNRKTLIGKLLEQPLLIVRLARLLKRLEPSAVLSFMPRSNVTAILARRLIGGPFRLLVSERVSIDANYQGWKAALITAVIKLAYPLADGVIAVSEGTKRELIRRGLPKEKIFAIPNGVSLPDIERQANNEAPHPWCSEPGQVVVSVGRLDEQKGHALLLQALAEVRKQRQHVRALIMGEGPLRAALENQARTLGLDHAVAFVGFQGNPFPTLAAADAFAFPSLWEGFPNALLEAMACGCPAVAFDCPYGPADLIGENEFGVLVPVGDVPRFARALGQVLDKAATPAGRAKLREQAQAGAARYALDSIYAKYLSALRFEEREAATPVDLTSVPADIPADSIGIGRKKSLP